MIHNKTFNCLPKMQLKPLGVAFNDFSFPCLVLFSKQESFTSKGLTVEHTVLYHTAKNFCDIPFTHQHNKQVHPSTVRLFNTANYLMLILHRRKQVTK